MLRDYEPSQLVGMQGVRVLQMGWPLVRHLGRKRGRSGAWEWFGTTFEQAKAIGLDNSSPVVEGGS